MKLEKLYHRLMYSTLDAIMRFVFKLQGVKYFRQDKQLLYVGKKVMVRSNEPDPLAVGTIVDFYNNGRWSSPLPIVEFADGVQYMVMGIILPFTQTLFDHLNKFQAIEQWNMVAADHAQIGEKYGVRYRTNAELLNDIETVHAQLNAF